MTQSPGPTDPARRFTALWVKAQPMVSSYVYGTVRRWHDCEDLIQKTAAAAYEHFGAYDASRPFTPWVMAITRNAVIDHLRRRSADPLVFDDATLSTLARVHEAFEPTLAHRREALQRCLSETSERQRRVLELRYHDNTPVQQIAEQLGTSANAVSLVLHKVRAALADCIRRRVADENPGTGGGRT